MEINSERLLHAVTALTEKRDIQALDEALVTTLQEIVSASSIRLYHLSNDPTTPDKRLVICTASNTGPASREPVALEAEPALEKCLSSADNVVESGGASPGVSIVHPVRSQSGMVGFLVVKCAEQNPRDEEIVSTLLRFYRNLTSLLHDTQRDELTGLLNRKTFDHKVYEIASAQAQAASGAGGDAPGACLAILDIDHFKRVNDTFGHLFGDEILLLFAQSLIEAFRGADLLFRIGGEEFVVVLKEIDLPRALLVLDRFRQKIADKEFPQVGEITTSIGVSLIQPNDWPTDIIDRADKALYYAKSNGRNQVHAYEDLIAQGKLHAKKPASDVELF